MYFEIYIFIGCLKDILKAYESEGKVPLISEYVFFPLPTSSPPHLLLQDVVSYKDSPGWLQTFRPPASAPQVLTPLACPSKVFVMGFKGGSQLKAKCDIT